MCPNCERGLSVNQKTGYEFHDCPSWPEEGWTRHQENTAKLRSDGATGSRGPEIPEPTTLSARTHGLRDFSRGVQATQLLRLSEAWSRLLRLARSHLWTAMHWPEACEGSLRLTDFPTQDATAQSAVRNAHSCARLIHGGNLIRNARTVVPVGKSINWNPDGFSLIATIDEVLFQVPFRVGVPFDEDLLPAPPNRSAIPLGWLGLSCRLRSLEPKHLTALEFRPRARP